MGAKEEEFDEYAGEFEKHLLTGLDYKLPEAGAAETHTPWNMWKLSHSVGELP